MIPSLAQRLLAASVFLLVAMLHSARAEEMTVQPTPFSVWIDLQRPPSRADSWPIWLEAIEVHDRLAPANRGMLHTVRLRVRRFTSVNQSLLMRLHFVDVRGLSPAVSGWSETAVESFHSDPLGQELGLATFENMAVPMENVDYIDIDVPGSGRNLLGVYLASLVPAKIAASVDFPPTDAVIDPFGAVLSDETPEIDTTLLGRVKATLLHESILLSNKQGNGAALEFELEALPLLALVTFDIANLNPAKPPQLVVNNVPLGTVEAALPDLADPAYRGVARPLDRDMEFHYTGWTRCQKMIPASALAAGLNRLEFHSDAQGEPVAIRSVGLQLKYNSSNFDYNLMPLPE